MKWTTHPIRSRRGVSAAVILLKAVDAPRLRISERPTSLVGTRTATLTPFPSTIEAFTIGAPAGSVPRIAVFQWGGIARVLNASLARRRGAGAVDGAYQRCGWTP